MKIVAFTGNSNSGKTTLIEKLSLLLNNKKVAVIKHDPKDKAILDKEGKDSDKFYKTGADVAILGATHTFFRFHESLQIKKIIDLFIEYDYIFVEGLKELPFQRICVAREVLDDRFFNYIEAIAIDETINTNDIPNKIDILNLNNPKEIIKWIDENIKDYNYEW